MKMQISSTEIWLADEPVDFRKSILGLSEIVLTHYQRNLNSAAYVFYNKARNKIKCLGCHRNGFVLIYKVLNKKRFTVKENATGLVALKEQELSWLLAGLDWENMSNWNELNYEDYY